MNDFVGVAIELKTKCRKCDGTIHINALTQKIPCPFCREELNLSLKTWEGILEDPIREAPDFDEGESTNSTVMGNINYQITYGRQIPRFPESKKNIDLKKAAEYAEKGNIEDPDTGKKHSFRKIPIEYANIFPEAMYLAMEDTGLVPGGIENKTVNAQEPVAFACPKCGGFLDVDGKNRMVKCSFCNVSVYLPDDLWMRLHPTDTITRWFILIDVKERPCTWDSDIWDIVVDGKNNIYLALENDRSKLELVSLDKDLKRRWERKDLEYYPETSNGDTRLAIDSRNKLMLWSGDKNSLLFLSTETGEIEDILGGKKGRQPSGSKNTFSMKDAFSLCSDDDGTFLVFHRRNKKDSDNDNYYELLRFDFDGNEIETWKINESNIFGKFKGILKSTKGPQYFEGLKDIPTKFRNSDIHVSTGYDGNYYLLSYDKLIKYSRDGKKIYFKKLDCSYTYSRACGDREGNAYVLSCKEGDRYYVLQISPDGKQMKRHLLSVLDEGVVGSEEVISLSEDGTFYLAGYSGRMRIISNNGKLIHRSKEAKEDEERKLEEKRKKED
ncbi:hypothetical protein JW890_03935 [candidate division WOR-3 bacterium]|nr:hypothetical protein [candidate division WOR-3 bacterium]